MRYLLALDQGTTSSRAIIFDVEGNAVSAVNIEFEQIYPQPGWVEHDPADILHSQTEAIKQAVKAADINPSDIVAIGITNQRETTLLWDRMTGEPLCNAIVWQCRRTAPECESLKKQGLAREIKRRTGLVPDAYFSGTKLKWMLDNIPGARARARRGELMFGTVDTWLVYNLSGGLVHVTDYSNASRTMLFNIHTLKWDDLILDALNIPEALLPRVVPNSGRVAMLDKRYLGVEIPISGMAGDQQAALFGQGCFEPGNAKNTYGTGGFLLLNTGSRCIDSKNGLISTIAWNICGKTTYALEGSVFIAGAAIQWLRDELGFISSAGQSEALAASVEDNGGVYFVPAFTGLGAPYWDMYARGAIVGLTRGSNRAHICRAALEAIAYQSRDVLDAMQRDAGMNLKALSVDGGASRNNLLLQFQADITGAPVDRPAVVETTALGAACLAGLGEGVWEGIEELRPFRRRERLFTPQMTPERREELYAQWLRAVRRCGG